MKKILFDLFSAQPIGRSKFHGGGEYIKSIFRELVVNLYDNVQMIVFYNQKVFLDDWIVVLIEEKNIAVHHIETLKEIESILKKEKFDIFYTGLLANYQNIFLSENMYKIGTIHGLRDLEKYSDKYAFLYEDSLVSSIKKLIKYVCELPLKKTYVKTYENILKKFDEIICVSDYTKASIKCNLEIKSSITVFYTPERYQCLKKNNIESNNNFILMIGGDRWIKNIYRAMKAIDHLISKRLILPETKIVIIGSVSRKIRKRIKNRDMFEFKSYVSTEELEKLYSTCRMFVYPTLNEGFGMPPLEAMAYGKTCVVSGVTSLPEVCGDCVYYANPYDIMELENKIYQAYMQPLDSQKIKKQYNIIKCKRDMDMVNVVKFILKKIDI